MAHLTLHERQKWDDPLTECGALSRLVAPAAQAAGVDLAGDLRCVASCRTRQHGSGRARVVTLGRKSRTDQVTWTLAPCTCIFFSPGISLHHVRVLDVQELTHTRTLIDPRGLHQNCRQHVLLCCFGGFRICFDHVPAVFKSTRGFRATQVPSHTVLPPSASSLRGVPVQVTVTKSTCAGARPGGVQRESGQATETTARLTSVRTALSPQGTKRAQRT